MASMRHIARLHAEPERPQNLTPMGVIPPNEVQACEPVRLPPERQVRARFVLSSPEPGYTLTPEIMTTVLESSGSRDYARGFEMLAEREQAEAMLRRLAARRLAARRMMAAI
jgi:hypothetical protein